MINYNYNTKELDKKSLLELIKSFPSRLPELQGSIDMGPKEARKLEIGDVVHIHIVDYIDPKKDPFISFEIISEVIDIDEEGIVFIDHRSIIEPESYREAYAGSGKSEKWEITISDLHTYESHAFFIKRLGKAKDNPEYFL